ncbi:MAG: hypothetical protein ACE5O2_16380 [Armatimonadota bacterium]
MWATLSLCSIMATAATSPEGVGQTWWDWDEEGVLDGWHANAEASQVEVRDGALRGVAAGPDPYFIAPVGSFSADDVGSIHVVMRCSQACQGAVYWMTEGDRDWDPTKMMDWNVAGGDEFQDIYVPVGAHELWKGTISRLRFDPVNGVPGARFAVDWFEFVPTAIRWGFDEDGWLEDWEPLNDLADVQVADGLLQARITGPDPYFYLPLHGIKAEQYVGLVVRMRLQRGQGGSVYFRQLGWAGFIPDGFVPMGIPGNDKWTETFVPFGDNPNWVGGICQFRLDPSDAGAVGATVAIDFVEMVPARDRWDFDDEGYFEGWYERTHMSQEKVSGGALIGASPWDPYMYAPVNPFPAESVRGVRFAGWGNYEGRWSVYWTRADSPACDEKMRADVVLEGGGNGYHQAFVDLSGHPEWRGRIMRLRLDPLNTTIGKSKDGRPPAAEALGEGDRLQFAIDWIEIVPAM